METGATVLVVSDAGMPTINDPGLAIVRRAIERGLPVTCAPGPSAVLDALALSGLPTDRFCYEGFLPRKHSERVQHLRMLQSERRTIVFYETPHRIADSMDDLLDAFGPNRAMALCRELTKDYEEIRRGMVGTIRQGVVDNPPRGEMVLVIGGASDEEAEAAAPATLSIDDLAVLAIDRALEDGVRIKDAIAQVVAEHPLGWLVAEPQAGVYGRSGNEILTYAAGRPSSRMVRARLTPGPPACATYSRSAASALGLATSQRRSSGSCSAMNQSTSGAVAGSHASSGESLSGGGGGAARVDRRDAVACSRRCRACIRLPGMLLRLARLA